MNSALRPGTSDSTTPLTPSAIIAQAQAQAVSATATSSTGEEDSTRQKIVDEMKDIKKELITWHREFVKNNNREPTKQDRDLQVGPQFRKYKQV
jgi:hypothetical protein